MLKGYDSWRKYLNNLQNEQNDERSSEEGSLFLAKVFQDEAANVQSSKSTENIIQTRSKTQDKEPKQESPARYGDLLRGEDASHAIKDYLGEYTPSIQKSDSKTPCLASESSGHGSSGYAPNDNSSTKTIDKQSVNTALLNFLKAITQHFLDISHSWTTYRKAFHATTNQVKLYETRTDECLSDKHGQSVCCLIEIKSARRDTKLNKIFIQECAQWHGFWLNQTTTSCVLIDALKYYKTGIRYS